ncbi:hypothetical protein D3C71_1968050 [compost metagenome]
MGLVRAVIGILPQDHHFDVRQLGKAESVKHVFLRWINGLTSLAFISYKGECIQKVRLLFLFADDVVPGEGGRHKHSPLFLLAIHGA